MSMLFLCGVLAQAGAISPSQIALHKQWMDKAQDLKEEIGEALESNAAAKAANAAGELTKICGREQQYWSDAGSADGVRLAKENLAASKELKAALSTGTLKDARLALTRVDASCRACHDLHLEKRTGGQAATRS